MAKSQNAPDSEKSDLWGEIEDDVQATFGAAVEFEIQEYGDYIEVHLDPSAAVEELEANHDLRVVPFNSCKMTVRRDE